MTVFIITNHEGRAWSGGSVADAYATVEEAEWLAWSISHRKVMWGGVSYAECTVVEVDFDEKKHRMLGPIDLRVNVIDAKKPGNYTIERKAA